MFYFVSKIVWFFLTPSNALLTLALVGRCLGMDALCDARVAD